MVMVNTSLRLNVIQIARSVPTISDFFFADDGIIFTRAIIQEAQQISSIF